MALRVRAADLWSVPGVLTLSRVVFAAWFPFVVNSPIHAAALVAAAALSDFLDGWYARRFHITSTTGAVLDPITDKLFGLSAMLSLLITEQLSILGAVLLSVREIGELPLVLWLAWAPGARRIRSRELHSILWGKLATTLQFAALICVLLAPRQQIIGIAGTALTGALAAIAYWIKFGKALQRASQVPQPTWRPCTRPPEPASEPRSQAHR
ncbi:MAG TPA: CDP-alcohol phosphatidyltransferase family protein [Polyangiales bacterium]|nr:CDP-alcohol phosphatidyltransferase family protein [Polyangiales bacterium]